MRALARARECGAGAKLRLPVKEHVKPRRVKHKCTLFPEPEYTGANHLEQWLKDLASCDQPLSVLAKQVPPSLPFLSALAAGVSVWSCNRCAHCTHGLWGGAVPVPVRVWALLLLSVADLSSHPR